MTINRAFIQFLETQGYGTFGTDIFIGSAPVDTEVPDNIWWVVANGGNNLSKNVTKEKQKNYILSVYYRGLNQQEVDETIQQLEVLMNDNNCIDIEGYDILETETTVFQSDQDLDNENRTVGLIQITLTVYKK